MKLGEIDVGALRDALNDEADAAHARINKAVEDGRATERLQTAVFTAVFVLISLANALKRFEGDGQPRGKERKRGLDL